MDHSGGANPNIKPALLKHLGKTHKADVLAEDVLAYIAALVAHPDFTSRFAEDLRQPGLRVPITEDANLFAEAAALGREVIWLHCHGERMADPENGRPSGPPKVKGSKKRTVTNQPNLIV